MRVRTLMAAFVLVLVSLCAASSSTVQSASPGPFTVVSANWGTTAKTNSTTTQTAEAGPGSIDVPLTITLQYATAASGSVNVVGLLELAGATINKQVETVFTDEYGNTTTTALASAVKPDTALTLTYYLDIAKTAELGTYIVPLELDWSSSATGNAVYYIQIVPVPIRVLGISRISFSASPLILKSGSLNNVSLTLSDIGSGNASQIVITTSGIGAIVVKPVVGFLTLGAGQSTTVEVGVYVPQTTSGSLVSLSVSASYVDSYGNSGSVTQSIGLYVESVPAPVLSFQAVQRSLVSGTINNVTVVMSNLGLVGVTDVVVTASFPSQSGTVLTQFTPVTVLGAGAQVNETVSVYVPVTTAGTKNSTTLQMTLAASCTDISGVSHSFSQTFGFFISAESTNFISVSELNSLVRVGSQQLISFAVKNNSTNSVISPAFSLAVSSPLVVTGNSTFTLPGKVLRPGQTVVYEARVAAGTGATPGFYTDTLTVNFDDSLGNPVTQSFSFGLTLGGNIQLIIQNPAVVQSSGDLVVSGTILNEGFTSAYYVTVSASVGTSKSQSGQYYVGEVDPNTPIPFSVTIPYTQVIQTSQNTSIPIEMSYQDSLGTQEVKSQALSAILSPSSLSTGTQTSSSTGINVLAILEYGILGVLVLVVVVGAFYVRRSRRGGSGGLETKSEPEEDKAVI